MHIGITFIVGGVFFVAVIIILSRILFVHRPDVDVSIGEKIAVIPDSAGVAVQMKCDFTSRKSATVINKMRIVINSEGQYIPRQFIEDFGNPYIGAKAHIVPIRVINEAHEGIEFVDSRERRAVWKPGLNVMLMKIWLEPNASEHSPSKMYRVDFSLDDHAVGALAQKNAGRQMINASVVSLHQVYPPISFKLAHGTAK